MLTLDDYKEYLNFSLDEYQEFQLVFLKKFVKHINKHSKHYRECLINDEISSYKDFSKLPLLEQVDLRERDIDEFRASSWNDICTVTRSSGTTGKSKIVLWTHDSLKWEKKWGALGFLMAGINSGSRYAILMPLEMSRIPSFIQVCESIGATAIPIGRIVSEVDEENAIELMRRLKATHILATPTRLQSIGSRILDMGLDIKKDFCIRHLITGGMYSTDVQKKSLEAMWHAELFEQAGANELSYMGFECSEHNGLHILPGSHYIETIDQVTGNPITDGVTPGEILVTAFSNRGTPLLRYRIGDLGVIKYEKCNCGLSFPRMFIQGRTIGTINLGGTKIYSYQIENILAKFVPSVSLCYRVTVEKIENVDVVNISIEAPLEQKESKTLSLKIYNAFLNDAASIYKILTKIKSGKVRIVIRLVPMRSMDRSSGDKIKNQFEDLRKDL